MTWMIVFFVLYFSVGFALAVADAIACRRAHYSLLDAAVNFLACSLIGPLLMAFYGVCRTPWAVCWCVGRLARSCRDGWRDGWSD